MGVLPATDGPGAVVGRVAGLHRYPVKSLGGETPERLELEHRGVVGDRLWAVVDEDGRFGSGKTTRRFRRMPGLLELRAAYDGDVPVVAFPDGRSVRGDDREVHAALSAHVGRSVRLAREGQVPHADEGPVHLVTTASLAAASGGAPVDGRRTRANLVLETDPGGFLEDGWLGRRLCVGSAELVLTDLMPRCAMLGAAQDGLPDDRSVLREVLRRHYGHLGLVADVSVPGSFALGDDARLS